MWHFKLKSIHVSYGPLRNVCVCVFGLNEFLIGWIDGGDGDADVVNPGHFICQLVQDS